MRDWRTASGSTNDLVERELLLHVVLLHNCQNVGIHLFEETCILHREFGCLSWQQALDHRSYLQSAKFKVWKEDLKNYATLSLVSQPKICIVCLLDLYNWQVDLVAAHLQLWRNDSANAEQPDVLYWHIACYCHTEQWTLFRPGIWLPSPVLTLRHIALASIQQSAVYYLAWQQSHWLVHINDQIFGIRNQHHLLFEETLVF